MTLGAPVQQHHRTRLGTVVLLVGVFLVLWAWGNWIYRTTQLSPAARNTPVVTRDEPWGETATPELQDVDSPDTPVTKAENARLIRLAFMVVTVGLLILLYLVGGFALARAARRRRAAALGKPPAPTPTPDAWAMHKPSPIDSDGPAADEDE